ncbi:MAG: acetolactate synthase small subunit [Gammaproteobacteria bacterium]|nr:acetolactate synthase small subunit [Gammaproteobacteria bacterium]
MRHTISLLVENKFGVLSRVAGLFSGRGYNIESISVGETLDTKISQMTIVTTGDDQIIEQITKQLNKLIDVVKLIDLTEGVHIERELLLIKVKAKGEERRNEVKRLTDIFRGHVIDVTDASYTVELTGTGEKLDAFISTLGKDILETVRSGASGIARGDKALHI